MPGNYSFTSIVRCTFSIDLNFSQNKFLFLDWTATGERNQLIDFDLESTPLQVLTDSEIGSGDLMWVQFLDSSADENKGGGISLYFDSQPTYYLGYCESKVHIPVNKLGTAKNRTWTIKKENTRMKLYCNGVEIFDIETQTSTKSECRARWSFDCAKIRFASTTYGTDTASDFYRKYISGKRIRNVIDLGVIYDLPFSMILLGIHDWKLDTAVSAI